MSGEAEGVLVLIVGGTVLAVWLRLLRALRRTSVLPRPAATLNSETPADSIIREMAAQPIQPQPDYAKLREIRARAEYAFLDPSYDYAQFWALLTEAIIACAGQPHLIEFMVLYRPREKYRSAGR
jgi:hypothetical protein